MAEPRHETKLAQWAKEGNVGTEPVAAATVLLLRDGAAGLETLMLRRNSKIAFGGMWVFPGGRVDDDDRAGLPEEDDQAHARVAAVREADEETGLQIGIDDMLPFSHWTPPPITPRRFLTWFFAAEAPGDNVRIDEGEIHEHRWMAPAEALELRDAAEIELAPPTWISLYELSQLASLDEAMSTLRTRTPERFETRIVVEGSGPIALWHGDAGYASAKADAPGPRHRLRMNEGIWRYERTHHP